MADGTMLDPNAIPIEGADLQGMQVDGGYVTPPNEVVTYMGGGDDFASIFYSQVDGADDGDDNVEANKESNEPTDNQPGGEAAASVEQEASGANVEQQPGGEASGPAEHVADELEPMETSVAKENAEKEAAPESEFHIKDNSII